MKKNTILIDPWGTGNTASYLNGLIYGISPDVNLTVFTNYGFSLETDAECTVKRVFFRWSDSMKRGSVRLVIRGVEYLLAYFRILCFVVANKPDIVHINWLMKYSVDSFFIRMMKGWCGKIVYTAHNVLPHVKSESYIQKLRTIYNSVDTIILHGESIKEEFCDYFPEYANKVCIQYHGANLHSNVGYDADIIDLSLKFEHREKVFLFFGRIFENKGVDRLIKIWTENEIRGTLIVCGEIREDYPHFEEMKKRITETSHIIFLDGFVDDNTLNYLIDFSDIILLPYRHASMSGVVFTAADFAKTLLCTNVGALPEYLENNVDSFCCENDDNALADAILQIDRSYTKEALADMGKKLKQNIENKCSWKTIGAGVVKNIYEK